MNLKIEKGKYLVVNEFEIIEGCLSEAEKIWEESDTREFVPQSVLYKKLDGQKLALLYEVNEFSELQGLLESGAYQQFVQSIAPIMASDFHQKVVGLVNNVRPRDKFIPTTPYMQLRSIEVPLSGIDPYLEWRERRIFEFVKHNEKVTSFLSFHSVFSTEPGVLFVAEFEINPDDFRNSFLTPEYQQIIKEAGHDHIKGGLHTQEYQLVVAPLILQSN